MNSLEKDLQISLAIQDVYNRAGGGPQVSLLVSSDIREHIRRLESSGSHHLRDMFDRIEERMYFPPMTCCATS